MAGWSDLKKADSTAIRLPDGVQAGALRLFTVDASFRRWEGSDFLTCQSDEPVLSSLSTFA